MKHGPIRLRDADATARIEAADGRGARTFSMRAYTGGKLRVGGWEHPVVVDLAQLYIPERVAILKDHDRAQLVGQTTRAAVVANELHVEGILSGDPDAPGPTRDILMHARNGFAWPVSIDVSPDRVERVQAGATVTVNGREFHGPLIRTHRSRLREISFVTIPADPDAVARVKGTSAMPHDTDTTTDSTIDRARAAEILRRWPTIAAEAIANGWDDGQCQAAADSVRATRDRAELEVLRASRPSAPAVRNGGAGSPPRDKVIAASFARQLGMSDAAIGKYWGVQAGEIAEKSPVGLGAATMEICAAAGEPQMHVGDGAARAMLRAADREMRGVAASGGGFSASAAGFSTLSLPGILSDVARRMIVERLTAAETIVPHICDEIETNDFRPFTRYRLDSTGSFKEVSQGGELKHIPLSESSYQNRLKTEGGMLGITRKDLVNDDLGAFGQIPNIFAEMALHAREHALFAEILGNAGNFFHPTNGNYFDGANSTLAVDQLDVARKMLREAKNAGGKFILATPHYLMVPPALESLMLRIVNAEFVNELTVVGKPSPAGNPHRGLTGAVSPYLGTASGIAGASNTAWYLLAKPRPGFAIAQMAYLSGHRTPTIEQSDADFDTLGIQFRAYWDFGAALFEPRAGVKSKGAA